MSAFNHSRSGTGLACDPRRVVSLRQGALSRRTAFDGVVVFSFLAVLTIAGLAVIGASLGSLLIVGFGFLGLVAFAARTYLADLGAGGVLRFAEAFKAGDTIHLYSADEHEYVDATVVRLGALRTTLAAPQGVLVVPNHQMLADDGERPTEPAQPAA